MMQRNYGRPEPEGNSGELLERNFLVRIASGDPLLSHGGRYPVSAVKALWLKNWYRMNR